jgi:4-amino-4-deoxy-L-arabinose transferase-like glycosyltransferase
VWWLAVGVAVGCGLLSKYTALFFGAQILLWLLLMKDQRRWLASPWPYLGGILAFAIFSPVILWNADHEWVSFIKQLGRARVEGITLKYLGEMIPTQFVFATPSVFILGVFGLYALAKGGLRMLRALCWSASASG